MKQVPQADVVFVETRARHGRATCLVMAVLRALSWPCYVPCYVPCGPGFFDCHEGQALEFLRARGNGASFDKLFVR